MSAANSQLDGPQSRRTSMTRTPSLPPQNRLKKPFGSPVTAMRRQETTHGDFAPLTPDLARASVDSTLFPPPAYQQGSPTHPIQDAGKMPQYTPSPLSRVDAVQGGHLSGATGPSSTNDEKTISGGGETPVPGNQDGQNNALRGRFPRRRRGTIVTHVEEAVIRQKYVLTLTKALLHYGAPSHRIEEALENASRVLEVDGHYVYLPGFVIVSFNDQARGTNMVHFVKADGHVALTTLHRVHEIMRKVADDKYSAAKGVQDLKALMRAPPQYSWPWRCVFAFLCAACISPLEFGGSIIDMGLAGLCSAFLQFLGMRVAARNESFATVFEITLALVISFIARIMSTLPGNYFCYNAISSAGIIFILPGFTVLVGSLEITSDNVLCGAVRMVYAIIYTLFLGFSLAIGSNAWLGMNDSSKRRLIELATEIANPQSFSAQFTSANKTEPIEVVGRFVLMNTAELSKNVMEGCFRDPRWGWWRQPLPWWSMFITVPIFSMAKSFANLQSWRSRDFFVMIFFSCFTFMTTRIGRMYTDRPEVISAIGAATIGMLGCLWSRLFKGTAFTISVTGVLFLVPVALAGDNGLSAMEDSNRTNGVILAMRMIQVAVGIVSGIFLSHAVVYAIGRKKTTGRFTF